MILIHVNRNFQLYFSIVPYRSMGIAVEHIQIYDVVSILRPSKFLSIINFLCVSTHSH